MRRPAPISHLPLGALRGFEAAARLKSFTAAAEGGQGVVLASRFEAAQGPTGSLLVTPFPDLSLPLTDCIMTVIEEPVTRTMTDAFVAWIESGTPARSPAIS